MKKYWKKAARVIVLALAVAALFCIPAFATGGGSGDVSGAISQAWKGASSRLRSSANWVWLITTIENMDNLNGQALRSCLPVLCSH